MCCVLRLLILGALSKIIMQSLNTTMNPTYRLLKLHDPQGNCMYFVAHVPVHLALSNHFVTQKVFYTMCTITNLMQSVRDFGTFFVNGTQFAEQTWSYIFLIFLLIFKNI